MAEDESDDEGAKPKNKTVKIGKKRAAPF